MNKTKLVQQENVHEITSSRNCQFLCNKNSRTYTHLLNVSDAAPNMATSSAPVCSCKTANENSLLDNQNHLQVPFIRFLLAYPSQKPQIRIEHVMLGGKKKKRKSCVIFSVKLCSLNTNVNIIKWVCQLNNTRLEPSLIFIQACCLDLIPEPYILHLWCAREDLFI